LHFKYGKYFLLTLGMIIIDQAVKVWVHYNIVLGEEVPVFGDWFKLHYILNEGMAFGIRFGSDYGKLGLTLFRIVAMVFISIYLYRMAKKGMHSGLLWSVALILGGAIGNVIDSTFYGVLFNNAPYDAITPWFHGRVIDMFYLDVWEGTVADWVPIWGGQQLALWPIFNVADASIFAGVFLILLNQKRFFRKVGAKSTLTQETETNRIKEEAQQEI
jgi:signal peptidase II